ncbi:D-glycero-beta-D-manno-heptose 1-phosphate adenylyltransferase [Portibacter marinus]|uniref:D-glycero-beta-D-manno-heptose 1-phosphate adenylyltransferase n=1 Tax=Portibacter marinus TaxID=2898660 RepID=UPI001F362F59|nr:D-glycero-beta-D-manno-heptose 1-phosphate adenylyltransferase [Portibacter marinus]
MKEHYLQKVKDHFREAEPVLGQWKTEKAKIVFTNGCFDILHSGHVQYLQEARELGDSLVIGVNDDASVQMLKGSHRPILPLRERMIMLAALQMVDLVIPFEEETPETLIRQVKPDILVKGGDYQLENIVGAEFVLKNGGDVRVLSFRDGISTSQIIDRIINRFK